MAMNEMNVKSIADDLADFLGDHPGQLARVHSVFPHAVNLLIGEYELITLTNQGDIPPMGVLVDCGETFTKLIKTGDEILLDVDHFRAVSRAFTMDLRDAETWKTGSMLSIDGRPVADIARIRLTLIRWLAKQPALGLLPLLPRLARQSLDQKPANDNIYSRYIANDLEVFTRAINISDWECALRLADRLIGFGIGSTPSCDDFLAAYLVILKIADRLNPGRFPWVPEFNQSIAHKAKNRTTLISATMLKHAADGKISQIHQQLIQTCLFNNTGELLHFADLVMKHGATSGGDFLLGLICALEWYQSAIMNTEKEGERAWVEPNQPQPMPGI